jgi:uncharacterized protein YkwD
MTKSISVYTILFLLILSFSKPVFAQADEHLWPDELNTAKNTSLLNDLEREVILELNKVRSNPKRYSELYLESLYSAYKGKIYNYPGQEPTLTKEGNGALVECILVLRKTPKLPILAPIDGLIKSARLLVSDQQFGGIGHIARNGSTPQKRMDIYGEWDITSAEDITYGSFEARQIVIALLIDDGVPDRGHRKNVLNPDFHFAGVAYGGHPTYHSMCVIDYAGKYKTK